jgi:hypothetical protein
MEHASVPSKSDSKLRKILRALLVAIAISGTAVAAAACGPSHQGSHHDTQTGGGY